MISPTLTFSPGPLPLSPVLPFSPNEASAELPGTIGLTPEIFALVNERVAEQLLKSGFRNVVLMGDHGGGQQQLGEVAKKLTEKYAAQGMKVALVRLEHDQASLPKDWTVATRARTLEVALP